MAKHSRHHHRSFFSKIKKWMGISHNTQKVHRKPFEKTETVEKPETSVQPLAIPSDELAGQAHTQHRQSRERTRHHRQQLKKGWIETIKSRFNRLFAGSRNPWRKSPANRLIIRIKEMLGLQTAVRRLRPELFYKLDKDGEYKVIQAKPVTSAGINEDGPATNALAGERIHHHRQKRLMGWKSRTRQLWRKFRRFFKMKQKRVRSHAHSAEVVNTYEEAITAFAQNEQVKKHYGRPKHGQLSFSELISSWQSLSLVLKLLSSMGLFMTAYVITWLTYSLAVMITASFYEIYGVLYYFEVMWPEGALLLLKENAAIAIALAGPFISLFMGLVYLGILKMAKNMGTQVKTLVFWLFLISLAHFMGAFAGGAITGQGFGYVLVWLNMPVVLKLLISILALIAMAWIGWKYARIILEIRPIRKHGNNIPLILINRMLLPCILGTLLLIVIKLPNITPRHPNIWVYDVIILVTVLFAVIPPVFNRKQRPVQHLSKSIISRDRTARAIFAIILSATVLILYRLGLSSGLYIYMKFAIHISSF